MNAWIAAALVAAWSLSAMAQEGARPTKSVEEMKELRKKAAHRKRRIIFNNDGNEPVYYAKAATAEALLECRTSALAGSQVDSIFYCTWSSGFGMFTHNTKVGETFTAKTGHFSKNLTEEFFKQGLDPLQIVVDWCRKNRVEVFWSMRMNDTHDVDVKAYPEMLPQFKRDHPEFLVGAKDKPTKYGRWTSVNYERPEVRERAFQVIREVCERYDVDGIEMDFFRHLTFFKSVAMGQPIRQEELDMMTDLIRRVRRMTEEVGLRRGKPLLVAVRVPDSVGYCREVGLDIERWLQEGLVDLMAVTCYFRLNPWEESVKLGHKYGVPVYPCLSESRVSPDPSKLRASPESYRARAMNAWHAGADGIYLFNFFNPRSPLWRELGDPQALEKLDKTYFVLVRDTKMMSYYFNGGAKFSTIPRLSPVHPLTLKPGQKHTMPLTIADSVHWGRAEGVTPDLKLRLLVQKLAKAEDLSVALNGKPLVNGALAGDWLEFPLPPDLVVKGQNRFELALSQEAKEPVVMQDLLVSVRYRKG